MTDFRMKRNLLIAVALILSLAGLRLRAQEWIVPEDKKAEVSPFLFTPETVKKGADIFSKNCKSCHGMPTQANWAKIQPEPGDPASEKFRKDTDGDMFYKITTGRGPMPQFRNILSDEERWTVISYIRSFHPGYVQPNPEMAKAAAKGGWARIDMKFDSASGKILLQVMHTKDNVTKPAANAGIILFVKRYFGNMPAGEAKTDAFGKASFTFPPNIPGNDSGYVTLIARLDENSGYGEAEKSAFLPGGTATHWVSLTEPRAMWNVRAKAPIWLTLAYSLAVLGVFATLIFIALRIKKIHDIGKSIESNQNPAT